MNKEFEPSPELCAGHAVMITEGPLMEAAQRLMHDERLSAGGNIRDKTVADLEYILGEGGQLWGWVENGRLLSVLTLQPLGEWQYLNNGVTRPDARGRGLNSTLLSSVLSQQPEDRKYIVIYVRQGLFERLGFSEKSVEELTETDMDIARIIRGKLRTGTEAHIFVR